MDEIVWRGMTRGQLDAAYKNSAAVENSAAKLAEWQDRSKRLRIERAGSIMSTRSSTWFGRADIPQPNHTIAVTLAAAHHRLWRRGVVRVAAPVARLSRRP
jgi:hypothetical protein